jgi:hypothetical protein
VEISYYNLGKIYNSLGLVNLSYICYKRAFESKLDFPKLVLPEDHKNRLYLYNVTDEKSTEVCPICGSIGELQSCYQYIEDKGLSDNNVIVKYRKCEKCNHIFAENFREEEKYLDEVEDKEAYIFNAYDIMEKIDKEKKLFILSENNILNKIFEKEFDVEYVRGSFEKCSDLNSIFNNIKKQKDRMLITIINDIESIFECEKQKPLWARPGVVNAYSKQSIEILLKANDIKNIKIINSKFLKGKIIVLAEI